jgi:hypothetical protein
MALVALRRQQELRDIAPFLREKPCAAADFLRSITFLLDL